VSCFSLVQIFFLLPLKPVTGSFKSKLKKVDFAGAFTNIVATTFILVPISSGGSSFPWSSPIVIVLLVLGVVALAVFIVIEWKFAALPILPLRLFKHRSLFLLAWISFLAGVYYYVNIYFLPIYFQVALNPLAGPLLSSGLLQALLLPQIATALAAGFVVQKYLPFFAIRTNLEWGAIILYYGWGMEFM
jgi:Fungal trichothecene efflux pump (TRI12)